MYVRMILCTIECVNEDTVYVCVNGIMHNILSVYISEIFFKKNIRLVKVAAD